MKYFSKIISWPIIIEIIISYRFCRSLLHPCPILNNYARNWTGKSRDALRCHGTETLHCSSQSWCWLPRSGIQKLVGREGIQVAWKMKTVTEILWKKAFLFSCMNDEDGNPWLNLQRTLASSWFQYSSQTGRPSIMRLPSWGPDPPTRSSVISNISKSVFNKSWNSAEKYFGLRKNFKWFFSHYDLMYDHWSPIGW